MKIISIKGKMVKFYNSKEISSYLGISKQTVRTYMRDGIISGRKIGRDWYATLNEIENFVIKGSSK